MQPKRRNFHAPGADVGRAGQVARGAGVGIDTVRFYERQGLATLSAEEARKQPTPADAVKALLTKEGKSTAPVEMAKVEPRKIPGPAGSVDVRIYTPKTDDKKPLPVIVYFHV